MLDARPALAWHARAARTRIRNGATLVGWRREWIPELAAGPETPVVFCTWRRLDRLAATLSDLAAQDVPTQAVIWNNSGDREAVEQIARRAEIRTTIHHSPRNIGGFGRFYVARALATEHEHVVFVDDDHRIGPAFVSGLQGAYRPRALSGWWAYRFTRPAYADLVPVPVGERATHLGTCGLIADSSVFTHGSLFRCPRRFWFVEDLWLSYFATQRLGWALYATDGDITWEPDELDQYRRLGNTKTRMLRHLIRQGWQLPVEDMRRAGSELRLDPAAAARVS